MAYTEARKRYNQTERGRETARAQSIRWRKENPEKYAASLRKHDLKRHYGITPDIWEVLFADQNHACAACKSPTSGRKNGQWRTDHDHATGKVRGILCNGCNIALGQTQDDPLRLRLLAEYLEDRRALRACD
jgi:hypothetical protein